MLSNVWSLMSLHPLQSNARKQAKEQKLNENDRECVRASTVLAASVPAPQCSVSA